MTRRSLLLSSILVALLLGGAALYLSLRPVPVATGPTPSPKASAKLRVDVDRLQVNGLRVVGLAPGRERDQLRTLSVVNRPSPEWEEGLLSTFRAQGGQAIKQMNLKKVDSFVWIHDGLALFVESVIVSLKGDQNRETTFRVLVDAQNGKILQHWDQPIVESPNPRENFRIKLDPRYHEE